MKRALRIIEGPAPRPAFVDTIPQRGYQPQWTSGCLCPGCGRSHWHVGRTLAECAFCQTALPFAPRQPATVDNITEFRRTTTPEAPAASPSKAAGALFLFRRGGAASASKSDAELVPAPDAPAATPIAAGAPVRPSNR